MNEQNTAAPAVSLIICTRNHASVLEQTICSLRGVDIPADLPTELIVADNGSTDNTSEIVRDAHLPAFARIRHVSEPRAGQCFARNTGIAAAKGKIILFTDDDLRFPTDWLEVMCRPIQTGEADAVVGGITLAPHLLRPWMTSLHRSYLASTENIDSDDPLLIGANMAFGRHVLEKVPLFDTNLGPGQRGFGDDTLFAEQLKKAGFRIVSRLQTAVEHHFDPTRLLYTSFVSASEKRGRTDAYITHHWGHSAPTMLPLRYAKASLRLAWQCLKQRPPAADTEGASFEEMQAVYFKAFLGQLMTEVRKPFLYEKQGMVKKSNEPLR